jgi:hypothetical protein
MTGLSEPHKSGRADRADRRTVTHANRSSDVHMAPRPRRQCDRPPFRRRVGHMAAPRVDLEANPCRGIRYSRHRAQACDAVHAERAVQERLMQEG